MPDGVEPTDKTSTARGPDFLVLWIIVTGLWTVATLVRIHRHWVPVLGWPGVIGSVYTWVSLLLPPWMFAIILLAAKRLAPARQ